MSDIDTLALELAHAKRLEDDARCTRIKCEERLIALLGAKDEGSQTHKGSQFKVTITGKINRTLDAGAWDAIKAYIPEKFHPVRYKPEIDTKGLRWLADNESGIYATVCQAIAAKPGKASVTVEAIENGN